MILVKSNPNPIQRFGQGYSSKISNPPRGKKRMYNVKLAESKLCDDDPTEARGVCCASLSSHSTPAGAGRCRCCHLYPPSTPLLPVGLPSCDLCALHTAQLGLWHRVKFLTFTLIFPSSFKSMRLLFPAAHWTLLSSRIHAQRLSSLQLCSTDNLFICPMIT